MFQNLALLGGIFAIGLLTAIWLRRSQAIACAQEGVFPHDETLNALPAGVWQTDAAGHCTHANNAWRTLIRQSGHDWRGIDWLGAFCPDQRETIAEQWLRAVAQERDIDLVWPLADFENGDQWLNIRARPRFDQAGKLVGYLCLSLDATGQKLSDIKLQNQAQSARIQAQDRTRFLARLSHDLYTSTQGIIPVAQLLAQSDLDALQSSQLLHIARSSQSMACLIEDIITASQSQDSQLSITTQETGIAQTLQHCADLLAPLAQTKGIKLAVWIDDTVPPKAQLDRVRVGQILRKLLGNAIAHTQTGGVDVEARVESASDGRFLLLSVIDTGTGISAENLALILRSPEPARSRQWCREEGNAPANQGPEGLDLPLANRLSQLMGGRLVVHSKPGIGSNFTLRLPLQECPTPAQPAPPFPMAGAKADSLLHGARILLVEDDPMCRHVLDTLSQRLGITLVSVSNREAAVASIRQANGHQEGFNAVLIDLDLPEDQAIATAEHLRSTGPNAQHLPIIAIAPSANRENEEICRKAGMRALLQKPVTSIALARELAKCLVTAQADDDQPTLSAQDSLYQRYCDRKRQLLTLIGRSLDRDAERTNWPLLAGELHRLADVAPQFGEAELAAVSRQLEQGIKGSQEPGLCQDHVRRAWKTLQRAA